MKVKLGKAGLLAAGVAIEKQSRYILSAICITHKETLSTDGHVAVRVPHREVCDESSPFLLRRDDALLLAKKLKKLPRDLRFVELSVETGDVPVADNQITANLGDVEFRCPQDHGQFPNIDALMPKDDSVVEFNVNPERLLHLLKALRKMSPDADSLKVAIYGGRDLKEARLITMKHGNITALMISQRS